MPKDTTRNVVFENGTENPYTILGFSDEATNFTEINEEYKKYLKGELGEQTENKTKAFEMLTSQENISKDPQNPMTRKERFDAKLSAERDQQIKDGKMTRLDMSKVNALSGTTTSKHVKEGSKIAKLHAALGHVPASPVVDNQQQQGPNDRPPSPRGVADTPNSPKQTQRKDGSLKEPTIVVEPAVNTRPSSTVEQSTSGKTTGTNTAGVFNAEAARRNRIRNANKRPVVSPEIKAANALAAENNAKEAAIHAKLVGARSFASKLRNSLSPTRLSTSGLSKKEELMKQEMMTQRVDQIKNMDKQDIKGYSKAAIQKRNSGGRGR